MARAFDALGCARFFNKTRTCICCARLKTQEKNSHFSNFSTTKSQKMDDTFVIYVCRTCPHITRTPRATHMTRMMHVHTAPRTTHMTRAPHMTRMMHIPRMTHN